MSIRRSKFIVTLLLLVSAILASTAYYSIPQPVQAAPTIFLTPTSGPRGTVVSISGSGFAAGDAGTYPCVDSTPLPDIVTSASCTFSAGGSVTGSFTVADVSPYIGAHSVRVQGSTSDFTSAAFTVTGPVIALNPTSGPVSTSVTITGSGFDTGDNCFTITVDTSTPNDIVSTTFICASFSGGSLTATFTVDGPGSDTPGVYTVIIDGGGTTPDSAQATFTVTAPTPTITLNPTSGPRGTVVSISGSGFAAGDAGGCFSVSSTPLPNIVTLISCTISSGGSVSGSFKVAHGAAPGAHTIKVTGSTGDSASASFTVTGPVIALNPTSGPVSTSVTITGSGFDTGDNCFTITVDTSTPNDIVSTTFICASFSGGSLTATFTVDGPGSDTPGVYTVIIDGGGTTPDSAQATFTVTAPTPTITLNPTSGSVSSVVTVTGSGFNPADVGSCVPITSTPLPNIVTLSSCTISSGGIVTGSFTVSSSATLGAHTIKVTGSTGDFATATFTVTVPTPTITLTPNSGPIGTGVTVSGSGFNPADGPGACASMTSSPTNIIAGGSSCTFNGLGQLTAPSTFTVISTAAPGTYVLTVKGIKGDSAQAIFTVTTPSPIITLSPNAGPAGTVVSVSGGGFNPTDTCSGIGSIPSGLMLSFICTFSDGHITAASFTVAAAGGTYIVKVTGSTGDFAQAIFTVTGASSGFLSILPSSGSTGASISLSGQLPNAGSVTCSISGTPVSDSSCTITTITSPPVALFTGAFIVASTTPGPYIITVTGDDGSTVSAIFTVVGPTVTLTPNSGAIGIFVSISGSGFSSTDTSCSFSSDAGTNGVCTINSSTGTASGSFIVADVTPGSYLVTVTGSSGDSAEAIFTVLSGPHITLTPAVGTPGTTVVVNGFGFLPAGSSCSISGTGVLNSACALVLGSGTPTGSFTIDNVAPGPYLITLSSGGGDSADAILTISNPFTPTLIVAPADGPTGTSVSVTGTGFSTNDVTCQLTASDPLLIASPSCSISNGAVTASFTVGGGSTPGGKTVTVTGNAGDHGSVSFKVDVSATLVFSLTLNGAAITSVSPGATVFVRFASGQLSSDSTSCTINSNPSGLFSSNIFCHIGSSGTDLTGTFFGVAASPTASSYSVTVVGNFGDTAVGTITVQFAPSLTLSPTFGHPGVTVSFVGLGLFSTDTSCTVTSSPFVPTNGASLQVNPTCSIGSGTATGSFVVNSLATADGSPWTVKVTGNPGVDFVTAQFTVVPNITVTPANGVSGTPVSVSGSGFSSKAVSGGCLLTSSPGGLFASGTGTCNFIVPGPNGDGQVSGTFTVASPQPPAGVYVITVSDGKGNSASATFTVGVPTAQVDISPNVIAPPITGTVSVAVTGFGFNGGDTTCSVTVSAPITVSGTCVISGGNTGVTLKVPVGTLAGLYLVTITGIQNGDFASNYLEIIAVTTMTSTTSTTSTSTTATSTTTLTTSTSISSSLTTTTITSTGPTTQVFTHYTQTSVSGITTTTSTTFAATLYATTQTTTTLTTVTFGQLIKPWSLEDDLGLFGALLLVLPYLLRRLFG